jgi:hypothetical protein
MLGETQIQDRRCNPSIQTKLSYTMHTREMKAILCYMFLHDTRTLEKSAVRVDFHYIGNRVPL